MSADICFQWLTKDICNIRRFIFHIDKIPIYLEDSKCNQWKLQWAMLLGFINNLLQPSARQNDTIKRLSCNHYFHNKCFLLYCFQTEGHIFIECPLCREINVNNKKPHDDDLLNIKELCKIGRCSHLTKKKRRCKKKSYILNDGYCTIHNKNYLPKNKYSLMSDYLYWLLIHGILSILTTSLL